jgi:hypothetical protein
MAKHVFISYAREDQAYTRELADHLRERGFSVWMDDRIDFGDRWWPTIVQNLRACGAFVVVMTPESERSEWVHREVLLALDERKPILPLLLRGEGFRILIDTQYANVTGERMPPEEFYDRLRQVLAGLEVPEPAPISDGDLLKGALPLNPFCDRGRINDPTHFFNRQRLLRELRQMLAAGNSISLVGGTEIGKSSLLYRLHQGRAEWSPEATVHYLDLQGVLDEEDFCADVLERLGRKPGGLRALKRALRRKRVVLLLDEVEKLADPAFSDCLHDLLRALAQEPTLTLAVASQRRLVDVFPPRSDTSPFHNIFSEKRLGPFTPDDARAFLAGRLKGTGVAFAAQEVERLVAESGGHPARLQRLACALFEQKRR